jgi:hypothetical protein
MIGVGGLISGRISFVAVMGQALNSRVDQQDGWNGWKGKGARGLTSGSDISVFL